MRVLELTQERAGLEVKRADAPIADVSDEHVIAESAEVLRGDDDCPGSIEDAAGEARREAPHELAVDVEEIHDAAPVARRSRERNRYQACVEDVDPVRAQAVRNVRIGER